jgi:hypothetical protein
MRKHLFLLLFAVHILSYAQTTTMIAVVLEDGKEQEYLNYEKNWHKVANEMVKDNLIVQWSVWKRTPRDGDDNWAQYYVFRRTSKEQDSNQDTTSWKESAKRALKGKSQRTIDKLLSSEGIVKENRSRTYKWVSGTGWRGLEWEIGDKGYFHFMKQNNNDFENYENSVWKPIAQQQILDGYRKFWGLAKIISKNDYSKKLESGFTHIAFNFMTNKKMPQGLSYNLIEDEFLRKKASEGLQASREMLPSEELTLVYSTF